MHFDLIIRRGRAPAPAPRLEERSETERILLKRWIFPKLKAFYICDIIDVGLIFYKFEQFDQFYLIFNCHLGLQMKASLHFG